MSSNAHCGICRSLCHSSLGEASSCSGGELTETRRSLCREQEAWSTQPLRNVFIKPLPSGLRALCGRGGGKWSGARGGG